MDIDVSTVTNLIKAVATHGGHIRSIIDDVQSLQALAKNRKLDADIVNKLLDVSVMIAETHTKNAGFEAELVAHKTELLAFKKALDTQQKIQQRKRNYVLSKTPVGARVYRLDEAAQPDQLPHEVCPACFERDQISILQPLGTLLQCYICKADYRNAEDSGPVVVPRDPDGWRGYP